METESISEVLYFGTGGLSTTKDFKEAEEYKLWTRQLQICLHAV